MFRGSLNLLIIGIGGYALLQVFPATKRIWSEVRTNYASSVSRKSLPVVASGAFLLGMGMTLAGSVSHMTVCVCVCLKCWVCLFVCLFVC